MRDVSENITIENIGANTAVVVSIQAATIWLDPWGAWSSIGLGFGRATPLADRSDSATGKPQRPT